MDEGAEDLWGGCNGDREEGHLPPSPSAGTIQGPRPGLGPYRLCAWADPFPSGPQSLITMGLLDEIVSESHWLMSPPGPCAISPDLTEPVCVWQDSPRECCLVLFCPAHIFPRSHPAVCH